MPIVIIFTNSASPFVAYFSAVFDPVLCLLPFVFYRRALLCFKPLALAGTAAPKAKRNTAAAFRTMAERTSCQHQTTGSGFQQIFMANK